jgi:hypothetical protein
MSCMRGDVNQFFWFALKGFTAVILFADPVIQELVRAHTHTHTHKLSLSLFILLYIAHKHPCKLSLSPFSLTFFLKLPPSLSCTHTHTHTLAQFVGASIACMCFSMPRSNFNWVSSKQASSMSWSRMHWKACANK